MLWFPTTALRDGTERRKVGYLVSKHSVRTMPGALLLSRGPEAGPGQFLKVSDSTHLTGQRGDGSGQDTSRPTDSLRHPSPLPNLAYWWECGQELHRTLAELLRSDMWRPTRSNGASYGVMGGVR
jgi:hypothetical protein